MEKNPTQTLLMPAFFYSADLTSTKGQKKLIRWTSAYVLLIILAALGSVANFTLWGTGLNSGGLLAAVAYIGTAALVISSIKRDSSRQWYGARAAAESTKTLAWRYAVGGDPFGVSVEASERIFLERLRAIVAELDEIPWIPTRGDQITTTMRQLRDQELDSRRRVYEIERVQDQIDWYNGRAHQARTARTRLSATAFVASVIGIGLACLRAAGALTAEWDGLFAAVLASLLAWSEMRQFEAQSNAYSIAAQELSIAKAAAQTIVTEIDWTRFVSDTEDAISREHTMWLARRSRIGE